MSINNDFNKDLIFNRAFINIRNILENEPLNIDTQIKIEQMVYNLFKLDSEMESDKLTRAEPRWYW